MTTYPLALKAVTQYSRRWLDQIGRRVHRIYDDRDTALAEGLKNLEAKSDSVYPAVLNFDSSLRAFALEELNGLVITGTNFVGSATKATGSTASSAGVVTFTAVLPGQQTITITITDTGAALAVTADRAAGTITIVHGLGGSGAGGSATAAEIVAAVNANSVAKYMVDATVGTAGDITVDETVTLVTYESDGHLPVLTIGSIAVTGSVAKTGITGFTETAITFDFDAKALEAGKMYMLRLWVNNALIGQYPCIAGGSPSVGKERIVKEEHFLQGSTSTLPAPHAKDMQTANITGDYVDNVANGQYAIAHNTTSEAQAGQLSWGDKVMIDLSKKATFEARFKINFAGATFSADQRAVVGVSSAHANAEDSLDAVTYSTWLRIEGANLNILLEADDNVTNTDDTDSGVDIVDDTFIYVKFDFSTLSAVRVWIDDVELSTTLNMSAVASNLVQPLFCIQRDAGAEAEVMRIDWYRASWNVE